MYNCITHLGYGELFGPRQLGESESASPDRYFRLAPLLHCTDGCSNADRSVHNEWPFLDEAADTDEDVRTNAVSNVTMIVA